MDREKALILVQAIITRYKDIDDETGTEIARLMDKALPPKAGEVGNAVPHKEEQ